MAAQLSYTIDQPIGYHGQLFGPTYDYDVVSFAAEGVVPFGTVVSRGTDGDKQCLVGGDYLGISIRSLDREGAVNTGDVDYGDTETVGVLRTGYLFVTCPAGCTAGDPVKYNTTTGVIDAGAAAAGETQLNEAEWFRSAAAGEIGVIRVEGSATTAVV